MADHANQEGLYEDGAIVEVKDGSLNLTIVPSPLSKNQLLHILQRTPKNHVFKRPGPGSREFEYVTGTYMKKVLNYAFGWLWDFQIIDKGREGKHLWVQGRLTIKNQELQPIIVKEQFGGAEVKSKANGDFVDYANDLKAAATDALKKCAAELGVASDIYGPNEFKEITELPQPAKSVATNNASRTVAKPPVMPQEGVSTTVEHVISQRQKLASQK